MQQAWVRPWWRLCSRRRAVAAAALAGLAALAAGYLLTGGPRTPGAGGGSDPWSAYRVGWTALPPPLSARAGAAVGWTGRALLVVDGSSPGGAPSRAASSFDPRSGEWTTLPPPPGPGRTGARAAWTGTELLVVGGYAAGRGSLSDGVAFDPATRRWRRLPRAPIPLRPDGSVVWTGSELIAFGGGPAGARVNAAGEAYDPGANRWRRIARAPLGMNAAEATWSGRRMVVVGSLLDSRREPATRVAVAEAYDPGADSWRILPASALSPQASSAARVAGRLVAWDYGGRAQEYRAGAARWRPLPRVPVRPAECYPESAGAGGALLAWYCGQAAVFRARVGRWTSLAGGPTAATLEGGARYPTAQLVGAGRVVVLVATAAVLRHGEVCVGCRGAAVRLWSYRPPG